MGPSISKQYRCARRLQWVQFAPECCFRLSMSHHFGVETLSLWSSQAWRCNRVIATGERMIFWVYPSNRATNSECNTRSHIAARTPKACDTRPGTTMRRYNSLFPARAKTTQDQVEHGGEGLQNTIQISAVTRISEYIILIDVLLPFCYTPELSMG